MKLLLIFGCFIALPALAQVVTIDGVVIPSKVLDMIGKTSATFEVEDIAILVKKAPGKKYKAVITEIVEVPTPVVISPVTIQAESFVSSLSSAVDVSGSLGVPRGQGGTLGYSKVNVEGKSKIMFYYALSGSSPACVVSIRIGGMEITKVTLPDTKGWGLFKNFTVSIPKMYGVQDVQLQVSRGLNLDSMTFSQ